jgi:predicted dehydrogenase
MRKLRLGMVGGGPGAFIGPVHRIAAAMDGHFALVAGAFASDPERSIAAGLALGLDAARCYPDYATMAAQEAARADGIEAVSIVTTNRTHYDIALAFLIAGIDVICEKPVTATLAQARALYEAVTQSGRVFVVTHNYSGYPMVREARARIAAGQIGRLRMVQVEYPQGWLAERVELQGDNKQANWRTDPAEAGAGGALGDIGTHAFQLACFVTGQTPQSLLADVAALAEGRALDDNACVLLRYAGGARGAIWASQIAIGCLNGLRLRVFGEIGGLDWSQEQPNELWVDRLGAPRQRIVPGGPDIGADAGRVTRLPAGHPEGFLEAFATIYADAAQLIRARRTGTNAPGAMPPGMRDGLLSLAFVDACVQSSRAGNIWVALQG